MKKILFAVLAMVVGDVNAQPTTNDLMGLHMPPALAAKLGEEAVFRSNNTWVNMMNASGTPVNAVRLNSSNNLEVNAPSGQSVLLEVAGTPVATLGTVGFTFSSAGQGVRLPAYVPTMAATPVAGTNIFQPNSLNVVPTAAANTAALLPATPIPGDSFVIVNSGPNSIRVKAGGVATLNGATAGGYMVLGTLASSTCVATAAANYNCELPVIPTPAGP